MAQHTPLYDWHVGAGARMIEFGGWDMPLQYTGIVEEHLAVRRAAGLFDVSHMGKLLVDGASAHTFLDGLSANEVSTTAGRARYTHLLRADGTTIDDLIITCLSAERFFVVCNAGPRAEVVRWLEDHRPADVRVRDLTLSHLCLALQGPQAPAILARLAPPDVSRLKPFWAAAVGVRLPPGHAAPVETKGWGSPPEDDLMAAASPLAPTPVSGGTPMLLTRTGYTGEAGFELFPPRGIGGQVWEALLGAGSALGLRPVGLGARDTLRLEKGYLLSGQDFDGRQTPLELNCAWIVKWEHPFLGRDALGAQRTRDGYRRLVGVRMDDRGIPRHGCTVLQGDPVGVVTSGTLSPSLRVGIALASLDPRAAPVGTSLGVDIRGAVHPAHVVPLPFV